MPWLIRDDRYVSREGRILDLKQLPDADALFLRWLDARAAAGESYHSLLPSVSGPGGYLAANLVEEEPELRRRPVYRATMDLLTRVAKRDGVKLPRGALDPGRGGVHSVTDVAQDLGISRAAVVRAIQEGRLAAYRMG